MVPNLYSCVIRKESPRGAEVSHYSNVSEIHKVYLTEEILSCLCIVWMVGLAFN